MRKYRVAIVLLIFLGVSFYFLKDTIASFLVRSYLKNAHQCTAHFGSFVFSPRGIRAREVGVISKQGTFHADSVDVAFSFGDVIFSKLSPFIESVRIEKGEIVTANYAIHDFFLHKDRVNQYRLLIAVIKIKEKRIENIQIPFRVNGNKIVLPKFLHPYLGPSACVEGLVRFDLPKRKFSLELECEQISLAHVTKIVYDKDDLLLEGEYSGDVFLSFVGSELASCEIALTNTSNGLIHIQRQAPLAFLEKRMEKGSYAALIDNLKDYRYNKGTITAYTKDNTVTLDLLFDSDTFGKRTVSINYHRE